jgi:hypothetical protein
MLSRFLGHLAADIAKRPARDRARYQTAFSPSWISRLRVGHLERRSRRFGCGWPRSSLWSGSGFSPAWIGLKLRA